MFCFNTGKAVAEGHGKSAKLSLWGDSVSLKVDIPLTFTPGNTVTFNILTVGHTIMLYLTYVHV